MAKLSDFVAQASKGAWTLDGDDGAPLVTVPQPTDGTMEEMAKQWSAISDATERGEMFLKAVAGDAYDSIISATEDTPAGTREAVFGDLLSHFGLGE